MPAKNPRINIVIEPAMLQAMNDIASEREISISALAKDLIREALEIREDVALTELAEAREESFCKDESLSHDEVWGDTP